MAGQMSQVAFKDDLYSTRSGRRPPRRQSMLGLFSDERLVDGGNQSSAALGYLVSKQCSLSKFRKSESAYFVYDQEEQLCEAGDRLPNFDPTVKIRGVVSNTMRW